MCTTQPSGQKLERMNQREKMPLLGGVQKGHTQLLAGHMILVASQVCTTQICGLGQEKVALGWATLAFKWEKGATEGDGGIKHGRQNNCWPPTLIRPS